MYSWCEFCAKSTFLCLETLHCVFPFKWTSLHFLLIPYSNTPLQLIKVNRQVQGIHISLSRLFGFIETIQIPIYLSLNGKGKRTCKLCYMRYVRTCGPVCSLYALSLLLQFPIPFLCFSHKRRICYVFVFVTLNQQIFYQRFSQKFSSGCTYFRRNLDLFITGKFECTKVTRHNVNILKARELSALIET